MILFDFSGAIHASVHVDLASQGAISQPMLRHLILNQLRNIHKRFSEKYGELTICLDSGNVWRRDYYPFYKFKRVQARAQDQLIDWNEVFKWINEIVSEIKEYLPYKVIRCERCEGDDIIAVLAEYLNENTEKFHHTLIVSNDKDLKQLHNTYTTQYFPLKNTIYKEKNPKFQLFELTCKGDPGDGICNIKSEPDTFAVEGKRQKPITTKNIKDWWENGIPANLMDRFAQNRQVINLNYIPKEYKEKIIEEFESQKSGNRSKLFIYFEKYGLKRMLDQITDF